MPTSTPTAPSATFGELLRQLRTAAGLTQQTLGDRVGYSRALIASLETNRRKPPVRAVVDVFIPALELAPQSPQAHRLLNLAATHTALDQSESESDTPVSEVLRLRERPKKLFATAADPLSALPGRVNRFVGREDDLANVRAMLIRQASTDTPRLVTLCGPGGAGKTRLAVEVANSVADDFPGGVRFVALDATMHASQVLAMTAIALGVQVDSVDLNALAGHLADRRILLVLDNCEHVLGICAELVAALLQSCPNLVILATSREALRVDGEYQYAVHSLSLADACDLFLERTRAVRHNITSIIQETETIAKLCQQLDCIPLAIEIATAQLNSLSLAQLSKKLSGHFLLAMQGRRTRPTRHNTLQATIDWSYESLTTEEKALIRKLAVYSGGWTLDALEALGDPQLVAALIRLVDRSLISVEEQGRTRRYRMLDSVRQYGLERLAETTEGDAARAAHLGYFANLVYGAFQQLEATGDIEAYNTCLRVEFVNTRSALEWGRVHRSPETVKLALGIFWYWYHQSNWQEGTDLLDDIVTNYSDVPPAHRARCQIYLATMLVRLGRYEQTIYHVETGVRLARECGELYAVVRGEALRSWFLSDYAEAMRVLQQSLALAQQSGLIGEVSLVYLVMGTRAFSERDHDSARDALTNCLQLANRYPHTRGNRFSALITLTQLAMREGRNAEADELIEECLAIAHRYESPELLVDALWLRALLSLRTNEIHTLWETVHKAVQLYEEIGTASGIGVYFTLAAKLCLDQGDLHTAMTLIQTAEQIHSTAKTIALREMTGYDELAASINDAQMKSNTFVNPLTVREAIKLVLELSQVQPSAPR